MGHDKWGIVIDGRASQNCLTAQMSAFTCSMLSSQDEDC